MIQELSENEILDYLMSSDFEEGLTPDEFKFLLYKFRNFYRVASCSISNHKDRMEFAIEESKRIQTQTEEKISKIESEKNELHSKIEKLFTRKLTWEERLKGKIIQKNED